MQRRQVVQAVGAGFVGTALSTTAGCLGGLGGPGRQFASRAWDYGARDVAAVTCTADLAIVVADGDLAAVSKASGEVAWQYWIGTPDDIERDEEGLYVWGTGGLRAVDVPSGDERWHADGDFQRCTRAADALVCSAASGRTTVGFELTTGDRLWTWEGNTIDTLSSDTGFVSGDALRALDLSDGTVRWQLPEGEDPVPRAVTDDLVLASETDETRSSLRAIEIATGDERWRRDGPPGFWTVEPIDGTIYGLLDAIDERTLVEALEPDSGAPRWTRDLGTDLAPDGIYGRAGETLLLSREWRRSPPDTVAIDVATGERRWSRSDRGVLTMTEDHVVLAARDGTFECLTPDGEPIWDGGMTVVPRFKPSFADEYRYNPLSTVATDAAVGAAFEGTTSLDLYATDGDHHAEVTLAATVDTLFGCEELVFAAGDDTLAAIRITGESRRLAD